jgi:aminopeptidase N
MILTRVLNLRTPLLDARALRRQARTRVQRRWTPAASRWAPDRSDGPRARASCLPRSAFGVVLALLCLLTGLARAETLEVSYAHETRTITLSVPETLVDALPDHSESPPDWLSPDDSGARFTGVLPEIDAGDRDKGAGPTGAYVHSLLGWLPDPAGVPRQLVLRSDLPVRGIATGALISDSTKNGGYQAIIRMVENWRATSILFGPYEIAERVMRLRSKPVALRTYFRPEDAPLAQDYLDATERYIQRFSDQIGAYPFDSYAVVSAPLPVGYAFDGLTYVSEDILSHSYMLGRSLAHEVLHSWWGSGVRVNAEVKFPRSAEVIFPTFGIW